MPEDRDAEADADPGDAGDAAEADADAGSKAPIIGPPGAEWPDRPPPRSRLQQQFHRPPPVGGAAARDQRGRGGRMRWRYILYGLFLLYLAGDLLLFRGPLKQRIESRRAFTATAADKALRNDWVATVNGEPITSTRLDHAVEVHLYQRGKTRADLGEGTLRHVRGAVLQQLIDDLLVEQHAAGRKHTVSEAQVGTAEARFESQFKDSAQLEQRSAAQGLDAQQRRDLLRQLTVQRDWLESHLAASPQVTEAIARQWFEDNRGSGIANGFGVDEALRARHLFLSTVSDDSPEREQLIRELHRQLTEDQADFATLAAKHSEDLRSKTRGGDLNWFTRARMPAEFFDAIAELAPGEISAPFRTPLGWHIVEVTGRQPAREASFEELREEIIAYLESEDRRQKIDDFLVSLRRTSIIQVFVEQL